MGLDLIGSEDTVIPQLHTVIIEQARMISQQSKDISRLISAMGETANALMESRQNALSLGMDVDDLRAKLLAVREGPANG